MVQLETATRERAVPPSPALPGPSPRRKWPSTWVNAQGATQGPHWSHLRWAGGPPECSVGVDWDGNQRVSYTILHPEELCLLCGQWQAQSPEMIVGERDEYSWGWGRAVQICMGTSVPAVVNRWVIHCYYFRLVPAAFSHNKAVSCLWAEFQMNALVGVGEGVSSGCCCGKRSG